MVEKSVKLPKEFEILKHEIEKLKHKNMKLKATKKYGLVWETEKDPEQVVADCQTKLPILKVAPHMIINDNSMHANILIEGDNYHALSVLNYTHKEKIDVIYIDPPYNTGNEDFKYNDKFVDKEDAYRHSKWLTFMYPRLNIAKSLLKNDGAVFISIGEQEVHNLRHICDEIFEDNFLGQFIRQGVRGGTRAQSIIATNHDYVLVYTKSNEAANLIGKKVDSLALDLEDKRGKYRKGRELNKWGAGSRREDAEGMYFPVSGPDGKEVYPIRNDGSEGRWRWGKKKMFKAVENDDLIFEKRSGGTYIVYEKVRVAGEREIAHPSLLIDPKFSNATGTEELKAIFGGKSPFSYPKPTSLVKYLIGMVDKNALVLDFFAGSGTTGHATLELNNEDGGNRRFILCTNNENDICTKVCYPRLEKVIKGYTDFDGSKIDGLGGNLRYFKTAFIDVDHVTSVSDEQRIKLTYQTGEMIALKEDTFEEVEKNDWWQIFTNGKKYTAIYFKEDKTKLYYLVEKLSKHKEKIALYIFSWGKNEYKNEFAEYKNIKVLDIPEPIIEVYKGINSL